MSARVLVIGESLVDIVELPGRTTEHVGGSPANVAVGLARQGVATQLLTRIGRDERGIRVAAHVAASGAAVTADSWADGATATAHARIAPDGSAGYEFAIEWAVPEHAPDADLVHGGSIAMFLDPGAEVVLAALERAAHAGAIVTYDPNIRPALVGDATTARARFVRAVRSAHLVKLSDEDAAWLYPDRIPEEVLPEIATLGPRVVVLTRGGEGAVAWGPGGIVEVPAWVVPVVDTIGAGDAYMASLITSILDDGTVLTDEDALVAAMRRAAVMAGLTVARAGAQPPLRSQVDALL